MSENEKAEKAPRTAAQQAKDDARSWIRVGEQRGRTLQIIWNYKWAETQMRWRGVGIDVEPGHGERDGQPHDYIDCGDPCWCGSDNCEVCLICGDENHD